MSALPLHERETLEQELGPEVMELFAIEDARRELHDRPIDGDEVEIMFALQKEEEGGPGVPGLKVSLSELKEIIEETDLQIVTIHRKGCLCRDSEKPEERFRDPGCDHAKGFN